MNEGDDKMSDIRTELEKELDFIEQELKDNLQDVIENAIDITLCVSLPSGEQTGFDINIVVGGPNIRLVYDKGVCQLRGAWGVYHGHKRRRQRDL
jgi:hypothetical protein